MDTTRNRVLVAVLCALLLTAGIALTLALARGEAPTPATVVSNDATSQLRAAEEQVRDRPDDPDAHATLAAASLAMLREGGDLVWLVRAEQHAEQALTLDRASFRALDVLASVASQRHRFADALSFADRSLAVAPDRFEPLALRADALLELGRYPEGFRAVAHRLRLRPDLPSYNRAAYARELKGDLQGAINLMQLALDAGAPGSEQHTRTRVQYGDLQLAAGQTALAEREMRLALLERPDDPRALSGLARVRVAQNRLDEAVQLLVRAEAALPLAEYPAAVSEIELSRGRPGVAREALDRALSLIRAEADAGVRVTLDLADIELDLQRPTQTDLTRIQAAYNERPSVFGDEVLGWALTRSDRCREGWRYAQRSLRLGGADAHAYFRAGMAADCLGLHARARALLEQALRMDRAFSITWAQVARTSLRRLSAG